MRIFGTPFRIRFLFRTIKDWITCAFMSEYPEHFDAQFIFVYFSYKPDYEYLYLSLQSLVENIEDDKIREVFLFEDQKACFAESQINELQMLCPKLVIKPVENFSWASVESSYAEIQCFLQASNNASDKDMIVKVDSDILFLQSTKMVRLLRSKYLAFGDGHWSRYRYAQGGLYMFRSKILTSVLGHLGVQDIVKAVHEVGSEGEDRVISYLLKKYNCAFQYTRMMLFPSEYRDVIKLNQFNKWDFCAVHFVKEKEKMKKYKMIFEKS